MEQLQYKGGGGFAFWAAQDTGFQSSARYSDGIEVDDHHKMVDTVITQVKSISLQTRHLRTRLEPDPGERGAGAYLPEDLVAYTIAAIEISHRGSGRGGPGDVIGLIPEHTNMMLRGLISCLSKLASVQFRERQDLGRESIRQAIVKRLLPEWKREAPYQQPLPPSRAFGHSCRGSRRCSRDARSRRSSPLLRQFNPHNDWGCIPPF